MFFIRLMFFIPSHVFFIPSHVFLAASCFFIPSHVFLSWDFGIFPKFLEKSVKNMKIIDFAWDRSISQRFQILLIFIPLKRYKSKLFIGTNIIKIREL